MLVQIFSQSWPATDPGVRNLPAPLASKPSSIGLLPQELVEHILDALKSDIRSLKNCSLTCRRWLLSNRAEYLLSGPTRLSIRSRTHPRWVEDKGREGGIGGATSQQTRRGAGLDIPLPQLSTRVSRPVFITSDLCKR